MRGSDAEWAAADLASPQYDATTWAPGPPLGYRSTLGGTSAKIARVTRRLVDDPGFPGIYRAEALIVAS